MRWGDCGLPQTLVRAPENVVANVRLSELSQSRAGLPSTVGLPPSRTTQEAPTRGVQ
jgi:hypothetical protein